MSLKEIIIKNNFKFQKRFGQNFISDKNLLSAIVEKSDLKETDTVIEIGVGGATLTRAIAEKVKKVYGYEIDKNLVGVISESLAGVENAEVIFKDFMKEKISDIEKMVGGNFSVVANLPYYITTPIIMKLIEESTLCEKIVVMVQEEVALRLCAKENTPDYGSITASIDAVANSKIIMRVSRDMFYPKPNVDSAVVRIDIDKNKYQIDDINAYRKTVKLAFSSRRKTLANNLINGLKITRVQAEDVLTKAGIDVACRGETLSTQSFIDLTSALKEMNLI